MFSFLTGYTPSIIGPVLTLAVYAIQARVRRSNALNTNQALTSLAIITLLTQPASTLLTAIPETVACIGCFERIQKFLLAPSCDDPRVHTGQSEGSRHDISPFNTAADIALQQVRGKRCRTQTNSEQNVEYQDMPPRDSTGSAMVIADMTVRPSPSSEPALVDIDLQITSSAITILTGPVGSGKSTLIKALLGELSLDSGSISMPSNSIAYCSQIPWILNLPIQQNICDLEPASAIDTEWYRTVLHACALDQDMTQLTNGDQAVPGSRGMTLSGGQKQRVVGCST
jgi:ATP-binding cassette subfamily C (CFTR/MRP) protein 1